MSTRSETRRLATAQIALLAGVAAVLTTLTLTRLQLFAVYENERDAVALLEYVGKQLAIPAAAPENGRFDLRSEVARAAATVGNPTDSEWLEDGRVLRRRGYLFDLVEAADGGWCLRAWPWERGATGVAAYAYSPKDGLLGNRNETAEDGWSGPERTPGGSWANWAATDAWLALEDSRTLGLASRTLP
ncbi:MAG: hypothetical protein R3F34_17635 [Planctomycetota bacterium]